MGAALAAPLTPNQDAPTTLNQTIRQSTTAVRGSYKPLVRSAGEPHAPRYDLMGRVTNESARARSRRSLLYIGHLSDNHYVDAQNPARLEPMIELAPSTFVSAAHPQDTLTTAVNAQTVRAMAECRYSPVTGAPMAAAVNTGDTADSHATTELRWMIDTLDGEDVVPNSGAPGVYEGPQVWDVPYVWLPDNPDGNIYGQYGFPRVEGLLDHAVSTTVNSGGLPVPYYVVIGNHDVIFMGTVAENAAVRESAIGSRKAKTTEAAMGMFLDQLTSNPSLAQRWANHLRLNFGQTSGIMNVTADAGRATFSSMDFIRELFNTKEVPGPKGHGFTQENLDNNTTYWKADLNPFVRAFGLDTCNYVNGADGAVPADQFNWLDQELAQAQQDGLLAIVLSHHNSVTLENPATLPGRPGQQLYHSEEFVAMLHKHPNMIAWVNGHTHINMITAHPNPSGTGGFWEITTASCIDYPQQQQLLEIVDNQDGSLSIFATTLDHLSAPEWNEGDLSVGGMGSLSRELAANHWLIDPLAHTGSHLDRNTELLLPSPIDMAGISDADIEKAQAAARARLVAFDQGGQG